MKWSKLISIPALGGYCQELGDKVAKEVGTRIVRITGEVGPEDNVKEKVFPNGWIPKESVSVEMLLIYLFVVTNDGRADNFPLNDELSVDLDVPESAGNLFRIKVTDKNGTICGVQVEAL